mgnify:CR=1 FL=1
MKEESEAMPQMMTFPASKESDNEYGGSVEREVKISSKLKALELLGKHLGMWNDKLDVNIASPIVISGEDALED